MDNVLIIAKGVHIHQCGIVVSNIAHGVAVLVQLRFYVKQDKNVAKKQFGMRTENLGIKVFVMIMTTIVNQIELNVV